MHQPAGPALPAIITVRCRHAMTQQLCKVSIKEHRAKWWVQVRTESDLVERSLQFEQAISGGDKETLLSYCHEQEQHSSAQEAETWQFLRLNIEGDARRYAFLVKQTREASAMAF